MRNLSPDKETDDSFTNGYEFESKVTAIDHIEPIILMEWRPGSTLE